MAGHTTRAQDKKGLRQWVARAEWPQSLRIFLRPWPLMIGVMMIGCLLSGLAVVVITYQTRMQYAELQILKQQNNQLHTEWGQLLLEEGAWSTPARIEKIATERLNMRIPDVHDVKVIKP